MEIPQTQTVNLLEFAENAYSEEVNIDMEGISSKRYSCNMCDFKNVDKGGMTRHVNAKHRLGGLKRQGQDESTHQKGDENKSKTEEFNPNMTSTQIPKPQLDLTVSGYSNESLMNLLDDKYEFNMNDVNVIIDNQNHDETTKDTPNETLVTAVEDAVLGADNALMSIRISKLEEELKLKSLECVEKDGTIETMENENFVLKEDMVKAKDELQFKDTLNEANLGKLNTLEEVLKKKSDRVRILEPLVNKMMQEAKSTNARASPTATNDKEETKKLKLEIKAKPQTLKVLSDQKSELANEIRDLQEKANNGQNKDVFEKCIKLTTEVNSRKTENKDLEKENKKLIETLSELQKKDE